jgi:hypothetical protein
VAANRPRGTRPRDLRGSYVTLRVYEGMPLTEITRHVGTSVAMLDRHYAGVIANWDGERVPADEQIRRARAGAAILHAPPMWWPRMRNRRLVDAWWTSADAARTIRRFKEPETPAIQRALHRTRTDDPFLTIRS